MFPSKLIEMGRESVLVEDKGKVKGGTEKLNVSTLKKKAVPALFVEKKRGILFEVVKVPQWKHRN